MKAVSVLVANAKGGCGKTTVATNLAAASARAGWATVLADCDRQKSSLAWAQRRPEDAAPVTVVDWVKSVTRLPKATQRLIIDAPAGVRRKQVEELIGDVDVIVLPVLPSLFDETTTRRFLGQLDKIKPIRKNKRAVAVVANRVRARTLATQRLESFFDELGVRPVARLRETQTYAQLAAEGLSLFDLDTQRIRGYREDWASLLQFIGDQA